jgi:hypothetical protein
VIICRMTHHVVVVFSVNAVAPSSLSVIGPIISAILIVLHHSRHGLIHHSRHSRGDGSSGDGGGSEEESEEG